MESNTSKPIIELNSVTKIFGDKPEIALSLIDQGLDAPSIQEQTSQVVAAADVSFSVNKGEIFMVMGLSGGKYFSRGNSCSGTRRVGVYMGEQAAISDCGPTP
ncbi:hypothetical protein QUF75_02195 [Desulfococcaceae bacterium HSG7]|nr:hypothetical protein [Desulfococcaceae bacterium HSG7]